MNKLSASGRQTSVDGLPFSREDSSDDIRRDHTLVDLHEDSDDESVLLPVEDEAGDSDDSDDDSGGSKISLVGGQPPPLVRRRSLSASLHQMSPKIGSSVVVTECRDDEMLSRRRRKGASKERQTPRRVSDQKTNRRSSSKFKSSNARYNPLNMRAISSFAQREAHSQESILRRLIVFDSSVQHCNTLTRDVEFMDEAEHVTQEELIDFGIGRMGMVHDLLDLYGSMMAITSGDSQLRNRKNRAARLEKSLLQKQKAIPRFWCDVFKPTQASMQEIQKTFRFHPLSAEDIMTTLPREKIEFYREYLFLTYSEEFFISGSNELKKHDVHIIISPYLLFTFHHEPLNSMDQICYMIEHPPFVHTLDWVLYSYIDAVTDGFMSLVNQVVAETDTLEELVLVLHRSEEADLLRRIGNARKRTKELQGKMLNKQEILLQLTKRPVRDIIGNQTRLYFRDIHDNIVLMVQRLKNCSHTLRSLHATYIAIISLDAGQSSNEMNKVMKRYAAVATIMLPLTFVAGLFGMNVTIPGQQGDIAWFWGIVGCSFGFAVLCLFAFKRLDWM